MSDLAPFVAAAIRDKVVEDLIKENARLRAQKAEADQQHHTVLLKDALQGFQQKYRVAVTPPPPLGEDEPPFAYAINRFWPQGPFPTGRFMWRKFAKFNECTLRDLLRAQVFINGEPCGAVIANDIDMELDIKFEITAENLREERPAIPASLDDVLVPGCAPLSFVVECSSARYDGEISFHLEGISKEKMFEFAGMDVEDFLATCNPSEYQWHMYHSVTIGQLVDFFGADTPVVFDEATGVDE